MNSGDEIFLVKNMCWTNIESTMALKATGTIAWKKNERNSVQMFHHKHTNTRGCWTDHRYQYRKSQRKPTVKRFILPESERQLHEETTNCVRTQFVPIASANSAKYHLFLVFLSSLFSGPLPFALSLHPSPSVQLDTMLSTVGVVR